MEDICLLAAPCETAGGDLSGTTSKVYYYSECVSFGNETSHHTNKRIYRIALLTSLNVCKLLLANFYPPPLVTATLNISEC